MKNLMKSTLIAFGLLAVLSAFTFPVGVVEWQKTTIDLGTIKSGESVSEKFYFTNQGDEAITIVKTKASCGCTVTDHSKAAIAPGDQGYVNATYKASKPGAFSKTIQVYTSAKEEPFRLTIKGVVE